MSKMLVVSLIFGITFILFIVFIAITVINNAQIEIPQKSDFSHEEKPIPKKNAECINGQKEKCTNSLDCTGYKICKEEKWSECIVIKICKPGDKTGCFINSCQMGYSTCNKCGTAYENCGTS